MNSGGDVWTNGANGTNGTNGVLRNGLERSGTLGRRRSKSGPKRVTFKLESDSPPRDGSTGGGAEPEAADGMPSWWPRAPTVPAPTASTTARTLENSPFPTSPPPPTVVVSPPPVTSSRTDEVDRSPQASAGVASGVWYPNGNGFASEPRREMAASPVGNGHRETAPASPPISAQYRGQPPMGHQDRGGVTPAQPIPGQIRSPMLVSYQERKAAQTINSSQAQSPAPIGSHILGGPSPSPPITASVVSSSANQITRTEPGNVPSWWPKSPSQETSAYALTTGGTQVFSGSRPGVSSPPPGVLESRTRISSPPPAGPGAASAVPDSGPPGLFDSRSRVSSPPPGHPEYRPALPHSISEPKRTEVRASRAGAPDSRTAGPPDVRPMSPAPLRPPPEPEYYDNTSPEWQARNAAPSLPPATGRGFPAVGDASGAANAPSAVPQQCRPQEVSVSRSQPRPFSPTTEEAPSASDRPTLVAPRVVMQANQTFLQSARDVVGIAPPLPAPPPGLDSTHPTEEDFWHLSPRPVRRLQPTADQGVVTGAGNDFAPDANEGSRGYLTGDAGSGLRSDVRSAVKSDVRSDVRGDFRGGEDVGRGSARGDTIGDAVRPPVTPQAVDDTWSQLLDVLADGASEQGDVESRRLHGLQGRYKDTLRRRPEYDLTSPSPPASHWQQRLQEDRHQQRLEDERGQQQLQQEQRQLQQQQQQQQQQRLLQQQEEERRIREKQEAMQREEEERRQHEEQLKLRRQEEERRRREEELAIQRQEEESRRREEQARWQREEEERRRQEEQRLLQERQEEEQRREHQRLLQEQQEEERRQEHQRLMQKQEEERRQEHQRLMQKQEEERRQEDQRLMQQQEEDRQRRDREQMLQKQEAERRRDLDLVRQQQEQRHIALQEELQRELQRQHQQPRNELQRQQQQWRQVTLHPQEQRQEALQQPHLQQEQHHPQQEQHRLTQVKQGEWRQQLQQEPQQSLQQGRYQPGPSLHQEVHQDQEHVIHPRQRPAAEWPHPATNAVSSTAGLRRHVSLREPGRQADVARRGGRVWDEDGDWARRGRAGAGASSLEGGSTGTGVSPESTRLEASRGDAARPGFTSPVLTPRDLASPEPSRSDLSRPDPSRPDQSRPDPSRPDPSRPDPSRSDLSRGGLGPADLSHSATQDGVIRESHTVSSSRWGSTDGPARGVPPENFSQREAPGGRSRSVERTILRHNQSEWGGSSPAPDGGQNRAKPAGQPVQRRASFQQSFQSPPPGGYVAPPSPSRSDPGWSRDEREPAESGRESPSPLDDELEICLKSVEEAMASLQDSVQKSAARRPDLNRSFEVASRDGAGGGRGGGGGGADWRRRSCDGMELESFSRGGGMWPRQRRREDGDAESADRSAPVAKGTGSWGVPRPLQHSARHLWTDGENNSSNWKRLVVGDWLLGSQDNRSDVVARQIALWEGQPTSPSSQASYQTRTLDRTQTLDWERTQDREWSDRRAVCVPSESGSTYSGGSQQRERTPVQQHVSEDARDEVGSQISRIGWESRHRHRNITDRMLPSSSGPSPQGTALQRYDSWRSSSQTPTPSPWQPASGPPWSPWQPAASPPQSPPDAWQSAVWSGRQTPQRSPSEQPSLPWQQQTTQLSWQPHMAQDGSWPAGGLNQTQRSNTLAETRGGSGFGRRPAVSAYPSQSATLPAGQPPSLAAWGSGEPPRAERDRASASAHGSPDGPQVAAPGGHWAAPLSPSGSVTSVDWNQLFETSSERSSCVDDSMSTTSASGDWQPALSRAEVVHWYQHHQLPRGAGVDALTGRAAAWFHGMVGRSEAEQRLLPCPPGAYLVRCSQRIWGYTLSYRAARRCKHFLVEAAEDGYRFYGNPDRMFRTLDELLRFHTMQPITAQGEELLRFPCTNHTNTTASQLVI